MEHHQPQQQKYRKFYVEWWKVSKRSIYGLITFVVVISAVVYGSWWAISTNFFAPKETGEAPKDAARIISFEGDVRITRVATRETIVVTKATYVAAGDTIQTQSDGRAVVQMIDGSTYSVRANSTVVIRDSSSLFGGTNIRVALDDGQINVRTDQQPENTQNVVEMMDSETRLKSQTDASFNADAVANGGEIRISRGSVETTVGGEKSVINANEFASVADGRITSKEQLLGAPRMVSPANMSQHVDNGQGVNMAFTWQDDAGGSSYYLQVSRSPFFAADAILVDRNGLTSRDFRLAALSPGTYYWRLRSTSRSGQTTEWNEPWRFTVVRREANRPIDVSEWGAERVGGNVYIVSGRTQAGMIVRTLGREVYAGGDGTFRIQVMTPQSEIAVEVADDRGNRAGFTLSLRNAHAVKRF
jgi:hypothetical protein